MAKRTILRPPGLAVFAGFVLLVGVLWYLFLDSAVERGVESTGASLVGARVDLESADVRASEGSVRLNRLQVTNPEQPMRNLLEADEIVADLMLGPLLEKKVVVQQLTVTGVRFDTERETSGALENPDPEAGRLWRNVNEWADRIEIPSLSLENLGGVVRTDAIDADSLASVRHAREVVSRVDSMRSDWESRLTELDPRPPIDSIEAVARRLESFRLTPLNAVQLPALLRDGRSAVERVTDLQQEVVALDEAVRAGVSSLDVGPEAWTRLRDQDLAYARSLLDIPSLTAPSISPALFGGTALTWMKPVMYWAQTAERFLPPGLDPRNRPGPKRARAPGKTFEFPEGAEYPAFLLERGELGVLIGGTGLAAGSYTANLRDLTTTPALLGRPMELSVGREGGTQGPTSLSLGMSLDHTSAPIRDSVALTMAGVTLPDIDLGEVGGTLGVGEGRTSFSVQRTGERIDARMSWRSDALSWQRAVPEARSEAGRALTPGTAEWARDLVWRTLAGVETLELDMAIGGTLDAPSLSVSSNLGEAVAASLQRALGDEIERAEARVRQEVDQRIQPVVQDARSRMDAAQAEVVDQVAARRQEVDELRARLEERIRALAGGGAAGTAAGGGVAGTAAAESSGAAGPDR